MESDISRQGSLPEPTSNKPLPDHPVPRPDEQNLPALHLKQSGGRFGRNRSEAPYWAPVFVLNNHNRNFAHSCKAQAFRHQAKSAS